jgi:hypothetical protein
MRHPGQVATLMPTTARSAAAGCSRGTAAAALRELVAAVHTTNRHLTDLRQRRAAERAAAAGKIVTNSGMQPDSDCCVCYEPLDRPHAVITACGHVYHRSCVENALESGRTRRCPICRRHIDAAELLQIMNGLPMRCETSQHDVDMSPPDANDVIDLTDTTTARLADESARASTTTRPNSAEQQEQTFTGAALDREIHESLERSRRMLESSDRICALEESVEAELENARTMVDEARRQAKEEKKKLLADVNEMSMAIKVRETKLRVAEDALRENRSLLNDQVADARRRAEELAISIKASEAARASAVESTAAADDAKVQCEERRVRFQRLANQFEKKMQQVKSDRDRMAQLEKENKNLQSMIEALRRQTRKARGGGPAALEAPNTTTRNDVNIGTLSATEWPSDILLAQPTSERSDCVENPIETSNTDIPVDAYDDDDDDDDDVVGAADQIYQGSKILANQMVARRGCSGESTTLTRFAESFGKLSGPNATLVATKRPQQTRPSLPQLAGVRRQVSRTAPGLGAFGPKPTVIPRRPGPIAAPQDPLGQPARRLGVKRACAPHARQPPTAKLRGTRIESFLKAKTYEQ